MAHEEDRESIARAMIDANLYLTLATADPSGRPWASPVYYAVAGYREFFWISEPEATHSRNLASRPQVAIVIFDSTAPINTGRGVYMTAVAEKLEGAELDRGIELFSRRSQEHGGEPFTASDVQPPASLRLYRATASDHSLLERRLPHRTPVNLGRT
jgi:uncharacterized protein YhbP (UPF0306 family)